jgi:hypothetical protein
MFKKKPKTKELKLAFRLSQLEEMRTKLKDALDNIDLDGFASVDDESGELHMTFTLEEDSRAKGNVIIRWENKNERN